MRPPAGHPRRVPRLLQPGPSGDANWRTTVEDRCTGVFQHHAQALGAADLEQIVAAYADDAVFITPTGVRHGKEGVREAFAQLPTTRQASRQSAGIEPGRRGTTGALLK